MKLTCKETHIISGALLIYSGAPFLYAKRRLGKKDRDLLQDLFDRIVNRRNREFATSGTCARAGADPTGGIARKRQVTMEWTFAEKEKTLLYRVLAACALESVKYDMTVFCGGAYRIKAADYLNVIDRIRKST